MKGETGENANTKGGGERRKGEKMKVKNDRRPGREPLVPIRACHAYPGELIAA